jgi:preprotein translocase subunit YajC
MAGGAGLLVPLQATPASDVLGSFLVPMVAIFAIFYFLMIRPQQKQQRQHQEMLKSIQKGDRIVSTGGVHGVVVGASDDVLTVDIGVHERVRVKLDRSRVERKLAPPKGEEE